MHERPHRLRAVAIGVSAGGVAALQRLLGALPAQFALPVLIVQHLAPGHSDSLATFLGQHCALQVSEAQEGLAITRGHVYLAPANYHLLVEADATLSLSTDAPVCFARPSIDVLFE